MWLYFERKANIHSNIDYKEHGKKINKQTKIPKKKKINNCDGNVS